MTPDGSATTDTSVVHVVLVEWRPETPADALAQLSEGVGRLRDQVPGISSVVCGPSVSVEGLESGFEWGLVITFTSADARDGYLPHPAHAPVAEIIGRWQQRLVVFDLQA